MDRGRDRYVWILSGQSRNLGLIRITTKEKELDGGGAAAAV